MSDDRAEFSRWADGIEKAVKAKAAEREQDALTRAIAEARQEVEDACPHEIANIAATLGVLAFAAMAILDELEERLVPLIEARAEAWDEGYRRGTLDATSDLEPADNPYREEARDA